MWCDWTVLAIALVGDERMTFQSNSRSIDSSKLLALAFEVLAVPVLLGLRKKSKSRALTDGPVIEDSERLSPTDDELALFVGEGQCHLAGCEVL